MMMQMNLLICIALMSSFLLSIASAVYAPFSEDVKGWTVVFKLFDTKCKGHITEADIEQFFGNSENAIFFNDCFKEKMYDLVTGPKAGDVITYDMFLGLVGNRKITTLQALEKAFPGKDSILGEDLNKRFNLNKMLHKFSSKKKYTLQEAAEKIDRLLRKHYYKNKLYHRERRSSPSSSIF